MYNLTKIFFLAPFLLILSTVFIIDRSMANGVVSGKYFWFYGSMGLVAIATFVHSLPLLLPLNPLKGTWEQSNPQLFRFSLTDYFVLLFAGSVFLSAFVLNNASANSTKLTLLALLLVLYFCLRITPRPLKGELKSPLGETTFGGSQLGVLFIILTGLVEAVWGLLQLYGFKPSQHGLFKLTGSFFNPGPYAGYLAVVFPLAIYYAGSYKKLKGVMGSCKKLQEVRRSYRKLEEVNFSTFSFYLLVFSSSLACIAIILVLPAAMSRAAWLAAIAGSLVVLAPLVTRHASRVTKKLSRLSFSFYLLVFSLLFAAITGMYYLKKDSADGRLLTWKVSLNTLAKHPFGVGLGNFSGAYGDAQAAYFASGNASETEEYVAGNPEYGFNEFLQIAIESGILSLLLFIGIIVCATKGLIRNKHWGIAGSLTALLVFACFSYPFSVLPFPVVFVFLLAMSEGDGTQMTRIKRIYTDNHLKSAPIRPIRVICVPLLCLSIIAFCLWTQYPKYEAYRQWNNNRRYYQMGMYKEATEKYEPLYPLLNDQIQFLFEYGRSLSQTEQWEKSNKVLQGATKISCDPMLYNIMGKNYQAMQQYDLAEEKLLKAAHIVPNRLYPHYLLIKLYVETGDMDKAREAARIVLTKEPKVQSTAVREMREEAGKLKDKN